MTGLTTVQPDPTCGGPPIKVEHPKEDIEEEEEEEGEEEMLIKEEEEEEVICLIIPGECGPVLTGLESPGVN